MRKIVVRVAIVLCAVVLGFSVGRMTQPSVVKASGRSRIVRVTGFNSAAFRNEETIPGTTMPGASNGTPVAISCTASEGGNAECYVLMQGN